MKTIDQLLREGLRSEHYMLIQKYSKPYWNNQSRSENTHGALKGSTTWSNTEEGHYFWLNIYTSLLEGTYRKPSNNIFLKL